MDHFAIVLARTDQVAPPEAREGGAGGAQQTASWVLVILGIVVLIWVLLRLQWRRQRRSPEESPVFQMRQTLVDRQAESERAGEVGEIVRDLASRLEVRAARLEVLMDQADERIEKLEARLAAGTVSGSVAAFEQPGRTHRADPGDPWAEQPDPPARASTGADPLHQEVYELADGGQTALDIARRLDQQVGTIELILALRQ